MENNIQTLYESITVPVPLLRAALGCASTDEKLFHMNGVYVHRVEDSIRLVGTDGTRALIASAPVPETAPEWLESGIIIERAGLARAVGFLASAKQETVEIGYLPGAGRVTIADMAGDCLFRVKPVEATFPPYQLSLDSLSFAGREMADMESAVYQPSMLRGVSDVAKLLDVSHVRLHTSENDGPSLVTFPQEPRVILLVMPTKQQSRALPAPTAKLLEGPLKGTIAALRAHQTRWEQRGEKARTQKDKTACQSKVEEYETRIADLITQVSQPALPAPMAEAEPEIPVMVEDISTGETVENAEPQETLEQLVAKSRGELRGKKLDRATVQFRADITEALGEEARQAYGVLPEDFDVTPWFCEGFSPEQAARQFIEHRRERMFEAWVIEATGEALPLDDETATLYRDAFAQGTKPEDLAGFIDAQRRNEYPQAAE